MDISGRQVVGYVPVTVLGIAAASVWLAFNGIRFQDVFAVGGVGTLFILVAVTN